MTADATIDWRQRCADVLCDVSEAQDWPWAKALLAALDEKYERDHALRKRAEAAEAKLATAVAIIKMLGGSLNGADSLRLFIGTDERLKAAAAFVAQIEAVKAEGES